VYYKLSPSAIEYIRDYHEKVHQQLINEMRASALKYAKKSGYVLNRNEKQLHQILRGLANNYSKYGSPYCPCVPIYNEADSVGFICPCAKHKEQLEIDGHCRCRLFFKGD